MNTPKKPEPTDAEILALAEEWGIDPARLRFIDGGPDENGDTRAALAAEYWQLTDVRLRASTEAANGLYIAESTKIIDRALAASHTPRSFFMTRLWFPRLAARLGEQWSSTHRSSSVPTHGWKTSPDSICTGERWHPWSVPTRCPSPRPWRAHDGSSSWKTSSTTRTWVRSSGLRRASASTLSCSLPNAPTPCTGDPSACRWGRSSKCRGAASHDGRTDWGSCGRPASPSPRSRSRRTVFR